MIYTAREGVERRTKEKILTAELIIVPLIMFGVTAYGFMGSGTPISTDPGSTSGTTLGVNTDDGGQGGGPSNSPGVSTDTNGAPAAGSADSSAATTSPTIAGSSASSSPRASGGGGSGGTEPTSTGGRGGGDDSSSGGGSCPCQTINGVIQTLTPLVPVPPPTTNLPTSGIL